jgi:hypothetical protein
VPIPLFPLVIPLDHEIRYIGDKSAPETAWTRREVDEFLVLGPLRLGGKDGFLRVGNGVSANGHST